MIGGLASRFDVRVLRRFIRRHLVEREVLDPEGIVTTKDQRPDNDVFSSRTFPGQS